MGGGNNIIEDRMKTDKKTDVEILLTGIQHVHHLQLKQHQQQRVSPPSSTLQSSDVVTTPTTTTTQHTLTKKITDMIVQDFLPPSFIQMSGFRNLIKEVAPSYV